jgi:hypothetical protein
MTEVAIWQLFLTAGDTMTEEQLALLREVAAGKRTFRCASNAEGPLRKFQAVADDLLRLEAAGYVAGCEAGRRRSRGSVTSTASTSAAG